MVQYYCPDKCTTMVMVDGVARRCEGQPVVDGKLAPGSYENDPTLPMCPWLNRWPKECKCEHPAFSYRGSVPCTGPYMCLKCNGVEDATSFNGKRGG